MVYASTLSKNNAKSTKWLFGLLFITILLTVWTAFHHAEVDENDLAINTERVKHKEIKQNENTLRRQVINNSDEKIVNFAANNTDDLLVPLGKLSRQPLNHAVYNAFNTHSWVVLVPQKKQKSLTPPPPSAPPVPFAFIGKLEDGPNGKQIFLIANNRLYTVLMGAKVNEQWRLDAEDANTLHFTYLPLNLAQIVSKAAKPVEQNQLTTAEVAQ